MEAVSPNDWTNATKPSAGVTSDSRWYFCFFFVSGLCSILYELIWLRLAMSQFGVTTPMVSIVLSSFMAGLGLGSWATGHLLRKYERRVVSRSLQLYATVEILIGCSAFLVPKELLAGRFVLEHVGNSLGLSSAGYYGAAGVWVAFTLIPWCACMGATIPLGMFAIRNNMPLESRRSFSFLYLANVLGAVAGALAPLLLVELLGFGRTLLFGSVFNLAIGTAALRLARKRVPRIGVGNDAAGEVSTAFSVGLRGLAGNTTLWLLFATGLTSMGMEVVWIRQYTVFVGTFVYSFAAILGVYLAATFIGSKAYRVWSGHHTSEGRWIWLFVWMAALVPLLTADPRVGIPAWLRVPLGIAAFSGLLGFLTPRLVDRFSAGDPDRAGLGYAVNVAGCILGPLVAGFALLPFLDERYALVALALPWLFVGVSFVMLRRPWTPYSFIAPGAIACYAILMVSLALIWLAESYVQRFPGAQIRRDSTATVIAAGQGMKKTLYVNGINMTLLTPAAKMMAAIPLALLESPPQKALVICFGMGTTHRSMLSWGIDSTAVDLVPSVPELFGYFHADAAQLLESPRSHVIIDDGRRFLERTTEQYDAIVVDPPPPIEAAGSSLLYTREFYATVQKHLRPQGILQQWFPGGDRATTASIARALQESFPYVRAFHSMEGWGVHYLASLAPIPDRSAADMAKRLPAAAEADLVEWGPFPTSELMFEAILDNEIPIDLLIGRDRRAPAMQDDRPINEYYLLRTAFGAQQR